MSKHTGAFGFRGSVLSVVVALALGLFVFGGTPVGAAEHSAGSWSSAAGWHPALSRLSARWWQWGLSQPATVNPLTDPSGRFCAQGQRGDIWFLAGNLDGTPASPIKRSCTIPAGKALFFPLVNAFSGYLIGADPADQDSVAAQREIVRTFGVHASAGLSVTVDGRPAPFRFEESVPFTVVLPIDNVYGLTDHFLLYPTVDAGYYSYLPPLCPGTHRLVFTGRLPGKPMLRVMYQLTIRR